VSKYGQQKGDRLNPDEREEGGSEGGREGGRSEKNKKLTCSNICTTTRSSMLSFPSCQYASRAEFLSPLSTLSAARRRFVPSGKATTRLLG
jgi:hypothetical protein